jgi:hypothetical protein
MDTKDLKVGDYFKFSKNYLCYVSKNINSEWVNIKYINKFSNTYYDSGKFNLSNKNNIITSLTSGEKEWLDLCIKENYFVPEPIQISQILKKLNL